MSKPKAQVINEVDEDKEKKVITEKK